MLLELKEYAQEVDVEFVRKAVRAIGRCAIKLERAAERCINVLLELIQTKVNYVLQEAVIVIKVRPGLTHVPPVSLLVWLWGHQVETSICVSLFSGVAVA